jgi:transcriptional regulator with XRE-family HTH domain
MTARESFGFSLRQERERRGVTLDAIAQTTKISARLLASLERGDVSRWPGGIYRRTFVRAYAAAIGLPPEPTLREFVRLFPEPGQDPPALLDDDDPRRLRLTLVAEPRWVARARLCLAAMLDAALILLIGHVVTTLSGGGLWAVTAAAAVAYHAIGTVLLGQSPAMWSATSGVFTIGERSTAGELARLRRGWLSEWLEPAKGSTEGHVVT